MRAGLLHASGPLALSCSGESRGKCGPRPQAGPPEPPPPADLRARKPLLGVLTEVCGGLFHGRTDQYTPCHHTDRCYHSVLPVKKLTLREVRPCPSGHPACKWHSDSRTQQPGLLAPTTAPSATLPSHRESLPAPAVGPRQVRQRHSSQDTRLRSWVCGDTGCSHLPILSGFPGSVARHQTQYIYLPDTSQIGPRGPQPPPSLSGSPEVASHGHLGHVLPPAWLLPSSWGDLPKSSV